MKPKRSIHTDDIRRTVIDLIGKVSFAMPGGVVDLYQTMSGRETSPLARETLDIICRNAAIAGAERLPLCQDCGMVIIFIEMGQDVAIEGDDINAVINGAVKEAYASLYLRKSIVGDPLSRKNTGTNTPAFIHTDIVPGSSFTLTVYLKGGGSENMTALKMFRPTTPVEEIIAYIAGHVAASGPNPCPPLFLGIGLGGTADTALLNSKKAVLRGPGSVHPDPWYAGLEARILEAVNETGVGPLGFGGASTAAGVFIREAPTHIATLPVALNLNCHSLRYCEASL
jgi:fumarate hydratase subunit alpha